jgi:hypothetical protein
VSLTSEALLSAAGGSAEGEVEPKNQMILLLQHSSQSTSPFGHELIGTKSRYRTLTLGLSIFTFYLHFFHKNNYQLLSSRFPQRLLSGWNISSIQRVRLEMAHSVT